MFKEYLAYIKDNPEGYWFRRKLYGWGWTPATKEGWLIIVLFIALIVWQGIRLASGGEPTERELIVFFVKTFSLVALLIFICWKKGEKPRWQWGIPKKEVSKQDG